MFSISASSMGVIGNLTEYMQFQAAEALGKDGGGGAAIQAGWGGLGMQIGQARRPDPWGARRRRRTPPARRQMPPPPPPVEHVWHVAENG